MSESDCPRNLTTIQCAENPVNRRSAQDFQMFSTSEKTALGGLRRVAGKEVELRSTNGQECPFPHFAVAQKLRATVWALPLGWKTSRIAPDFGARGFTSTS